MAKQHTSPKVVSRLNRKERGRKKFRPELGITRLCVYRSNRHISALLIDDNADKVLSSVSTMSKEIAEQVKGHCNIDAAKKVGGAIAEIAKGLKIEKIFFDRNGFRYHGKVKALADAAREAGLKF